MNKSCKLLVQGLGGLALIIFSGVHEIKEPITWVICFIVTTPYYILIDNIWNDKK